MKEERYREEMPFYESQIFFFFSDFKDYSEDLSKEKQDDSGNSNVNQELSEIYKQNYRQD